MMSLHFFASAQSFSDPHTIKLQYPDGSVKEVDYGPWKYKEIVKQCVEISEAIHTSYTDLLSISPTERNYIYEYLREKADRLKKRMEEKERQLNEKMGKKKK